jgi:peptidoglycan-N-acetylglucosamine deacetylase
MPLLAPHFWKKKNYKWCSIFNRDRYFVKTPWFIKQLFNNCIWDIKESGKNLFLTFDDGPHPTITPFLLQVLKKYNAKATFFCIGENVQKYPQVYQQIIADGHAVGNHTMHHINGWKNNVNDYLTNINQAAALINSNLFRPPYGRITKPQIKALQNNKHIIMWNILAGDWVQNLEPEACYQRVFSAIKNNQIIVFHDSDKAEARVTYCIPKLLQQATNAGYTFKKIEIK